MEEDKFQKRISRLYEKRTALENELYNFHAIILENIENQSRSKKNDTIILKCKTLLEQAVDINTNILHIAGKTENPDKYIPTQDLWLHKLKEANSKILVEAENFKTRRKEEEAVALDTAEKDQFLEIADEVKSTQLTEGSESKVSQSASKLSRTKKTHKSGSSRCTLAASKTSSQRRRDLEMNMLRQEEMEKQAEVALKLKKQQNELELLQLAEDHRKKLKEMEFARIQIEDDLSSVSDRLDHTNFTKVSLQVDSKKEDDRTASWVNSVKNQVSLDLAAAIEVRSDIGASTSQPNGLPSLPEFQVNSTLAHNAGHATYSDPGGPKPVHSASRPILPYSNMSLHSVDGSVNLPRLLAPLPSVSEHPGFAVPSVSVISPSPNATIAGNTFSIPGPIPGNHLLRSVPQHPLPVVSFAPVTQPMIPQFTQPLFPPMTTMHATSYQPPMHPPFAATLSTSVNVPPAVDSNIMVCRFPTQAPVMTPHQNVNANLFSKSTSIVPATQNVRPYTCCGTVYYTQPAPQPVPAPQPIHTIPIANHQGYAGYISGPAQEYPAERPLSARELAELLKGSRKDRLPELTLGDFDGDPLNWFEWFGHFKAIIDSADLTDDEKLAYLKRHVTKKAKAAIAEYSFSGVLYQDALATLQRKFGQPHTIVAAHLEKLRNFPPLKMHNSENVISFSSTISGLVAVFKSLEFTDDLKSVTLLNEAVNKLPPNLKEAWSMLIVRKGWQRPTLLDFNFWLKEKAEGHERLKSLSTKSKTEDVVKPKTTRVLASNTRTNADNRDKTNFPPCPLCKGKHALWSCSSFKEKNATQRAKFAAEQKLCFSCLTGNHSFRKCTKAKKCSKPGCESNHNVLLHGADRIFPPKETNSADKSNSKSTEKNTASHAAIGTTDNETSSKGLLQIAAIGVSSNGTSFRSLAFCDSGSTHTWIAASLAERLNLIGEPVKLANTGFNSTVVIETHRVKFNISAKPNKVDFNFTVEAYIKKDMFISDENINIPELQDKYPQLAPVESTSYNYRDVEVVLGQDYYHFVRPLEFILGEDSNSPCAVRLPIGWVVSGPVPPSVKHTSACFKCVVEDSSLTDQIKGWYELESYGTYKQFDARSAADKRALSILKSKTVHDGERYVVPMLWADDDISLPNNFYSSLAQLKTLEKRLSKDPDLRDKYLENIREDIRKGYVVTVKPHDPLTRSDREWYLPHHPVVNPNKPGKVRRVLNGAAKFHGNSLNKSLLVGPDLLQSLIYVLLRFRQHKYAVSADIEGMFLQVGVLERDQPSLRFLWREDPTSDVVVHQYTRHIFGARDSPTCANFALQKTATDNQSVYPEAASVVNQKFYMDDYLDSFEHPEQALKISQDLVSLLKLGGFNLTKFVSNVPEITSAMCTDKVEPLPPVKEIGKIVVSSSHVLGLRWDHVKDTLVVSRGVDKPLDKSVTQRLILSFVSSVFDPIGLVAPYTVSARLLLKDIWRISGQNWDDELPNEIKQKFIEWHSGLPLLGQITIPRSYFTEPVDIIELHMFGDSSQDIFCAVAFLRARLANSHATQISFVFGKARVAPMKSLSIPKLELQAALLATRLKDEIVKALTVQISDIFMWTDSTTVLQWLNSTDKQPVFVGNRTGEILESTTIDQWHHVLSGDNPADTGTRGISSEALKDSSWVKGPSFLQTPDWPFKPNEDVVRKIRLKGPVYDVDSCLEHTSTFVADTTPDKSNEHWFDWDRFSSFKRFKRTVAFMLRLLPSHKRFRGAELVITDPDELSIAESKLIRLSQAESFPSELKMLTAGKAIKPSSKIAMYTPFLGPSRIIRSRGRISRLTETEFDTKHPIVLDGRHALVKLLIRDIHLENSHEGLDYQRSIVNLKYAVLKLRWLLKLIENRCFRCRKRKAKTITPIMADLPIERLGYKQPPFSNTGVDYFGPFYVPVRRSTEKRWGFLFTCLTTRAVHIELVPSLDTSSCVMGIERFVARRGTPLTIWSDNGTNFVGAEKELIACIKAWNDMAPSVFAHKGVKWKFNPPGAPHHGGSWERLVRSVKRVLYDILGSRRVTEEVLGTTLCLVEQSLNARPITPVNTDARELEALTPNHFLLGQHAASFPSLFPGEHFNHRKRFVQAQSYANAIWSRWLREYVPLLNKRVKWRADSDITLKTGDLVWVIEADSPRGYYPLARIVKLHYGKDGCARSATVKIATSELSRPTVKLAPVLPSLGAEDVAAQF